MYNTQSSKKSACCGTKTSETANMGGEAGSVYSPAVEELVAIGAAIACNCERCFKYHYLQAKKLGISHDDMARAVTIAQKVKNSPARAIIELAQRHLQGARIATEAFGAPDACADPKLDEPDEAPSPCCSKGG
ncbi:MAG TPA: carboxymuconolactone decarboxylase family protein [Phycisphaerae bacterium]|nr:carboxymuconolactone decarboxylase family protein [Phycisphaerae bacterium]